MADFIRDQSFVFLKGEESMIKSMNITLMKKENQTEKIEVSEFREPISISSRASCDVISIGFPEGITKSFYYEFMKQAKKYQFHSLTTLKMLLGIDLELEEASFLFECLKLKYNGILLETKNRDTLEVQSLKLDFDLGKEKVSLTWTPDGVEVTFKGKSKSIKDLKRIAKLLRDELVNALDEEIEDQLKDFLLEKAKEFPKSLGYKVFLERWKHKILTRNLFAEVHKSFGNPGDPVNYLKQYRKKIGIEFIDKQSDYARIKKEIKGAFKNLDSQIKSLTSKQEKNV